MSILPPAIQKLGKGVEESLAQMVTGAGSRHSERTAFP